MRRASYIETNIDLNHHQEKVAQLKKCCEKQKWNDKIIDLITWLVINKNNIKKKLEKWKKIPHQFCEQLKPEKYKLNENAIDLTI